MGLGVRTPLTTSSPCASITEADQRLVVHQVLPEELVLSAVGVTREEHAGAAGAPHVAKGHGLKQDVIKIRKWRHIIVNYLYNAPAH